MGGAILGATGAARGQASFRRPPRGGHGVAGAVPPAGGGARRPLRPGWVSVAVPWAAGGADSAQAALCTEGGGTMAFPGGRGREGAGYGKGAAAAAPSWPRACVPARRWEAQCSGRREGQRGEGRSGGEGERGTAAGGGQCRRGGGRAARSPRLLWGAAGWAGRRRRPATARCAAGRGGCGVPREEEEGAAQPLGGTHRPCAGRAVQRAGGWWAAGASPLPQTRPLLQARVLLAPSRRLLVTARLPWARQDAAECRFKSADFFFFFSKPHWRLHVWVGTELGCPFLVTVKTKQSPLYVWVCGFFFPVSLVCHHKWGDTFYNSPNCA